MAKSCAPYGMHRIPVSKALRMHGANQVRYLTQLSMSQAFTRLCTSVNPCKDVPGPELSRQSGPTASGHNRCNSNLCSYFFLILPDQYTCSQLLATVSFCQGSPLHFYVKQHTAIKHIPSSRKQCLTSWSLKLHKVCHVLFLIST